MSVAASHPPLWVTQATLAPSAPSPMASPMPRTPLQHATPAPQTPAPQTRRQPTGTSVISSRVLSSTPVGNPDLTQDRVRVVEVPMQQDVTRQVNVRRIIEREMHVPKYETTEVKRIVDVPKVTILQKNVEVPRIKEVVKTIPVKKVVEVERECFTHVPKIETKTVEREIEVMGEVIEVPKPFLIENRVVVPRFIDQLVPVVVSQTLTPTFVESSEHTIEVRLKEYEPEVIPVDIFLPRPIDRNIVIAGDINRYHAPVNIPLAQYNSLIMSLNSNQTEHVKKVVGGVSNSSSPRASLKGGRSMSGQFEEIVEANEEEKQNADASFWLDHMLIPAPTGAVPILGKDIEIISPSSNDWMAQYNEDSDYVIRSVSTASCSHCESQTSHRKKSGKTEECAACLRFKDLHHQFPTASVDVTEFRDDDGMKHTHLSESQMSQMSDRKE